MTSNLSSTSALVLLWTNGEIHTSKIAKKFLGILNLESGKLILAKCNEFWPHYAQVVKNRKSCILYLTKKHISENSIDQVIILGAGLDALSLEIHSCYKKCRIFEIDTANMKLKQDLIYSIDSTISDYITCITADLCNSEKIISKLILHGWNKDKPSLIIIEGLSYYLSEHTLWEIIDKFKIKNHHNTIILEYLIPQSTIPKKLQTIAKYPFDVISEDSKLTFITKYDTHDIQTHVKKLDGTILGHYDMKKMENQRTLRNSIFTPTCPGWIEISEIVI